MSAPRRLSPRSLLFLPASNPRAVAKARMLKADCVVLDLEDAVPRSDKAAARAAAVAAVAEGFGPRLTAIRINGVADGEHTDDLEAVAASVADYVVLPKVENASDAAVVGSACRRPVLAMIETPPGVLAAAEIAEVAAVHGLIAGVNDLRASLGIPAGADRAGVALALQTVVLAARASGGWAIDGVFNLLDDTDGLVAECRAGRDMGFDGKSLIHPGQVDACNRAFGPSDAEVEDARALLAAATDGAERFRGRMIEAMHVAQAQAVVARVR
ncbi:citrate lyase subunit beta / citryl-CoA lyase [Sphingomonas guangdongensis]|uniref:Citrate lyase subunit beta / citryl-CoA lyase n=1 Tax=Sphingomonas guangdongensis TaxID=1141890 RepID=A0A285R056_9SPHN|nr:CoA ester lyase [Sphingomonas guangdongensis]SOB87535.1 citrate lyase subunit beta / citryl-CoA lyase [Sphingomonas guangdongensis]